MRLELDDINLALRADPKGYVSRCDALYNSRVNKAAELIVNRQNRSRVALLAGPSSSGKTTTATRIRRALEARGVYAHMISLDDYYRLKSEPDFPRTKDGELDLEAPEGLDTALLGRHLEALDRDVKKPKENPSVGVILCTGKDDTVVEYALSRSMSPTLVSDYQLRLPDKKLLQNKLRELTELALENGEEDEE